MIIKGIQDAGEAGRTFFPLEDFAVTVEHFVVRQTTPANPFGPHKHEQRELWYIAEGNAFFIRDGEEESVEEGDLIAIEPWVEHGLRTDTRVTWICLG